jgi:RNA polymerase sigma-70 factor, ECF subfamily
MCVPPETLATPAAVGGQRDYLVRYARRRLRDPALAEDVVHDVLAAVIAGQARFEGRSSLRTWLVGILKHKMVDMLRRHAGECSLDARIEDGWNRADTAPHAIEPSLLVEQRQSLAEVLSRIAALPPSLRHAFEQCVLLERSTGEICEQLDITPANLWVRVHRARKALGSSEPVRAVRGGVFAG